MSALGLSFRFAGLPRGGGELAPPQAKLFVFAGQSNMDNGSGTQGRYASLDSGIKIWYNDEWQTYDPAANASNQAVGQWGPEAEALYQFRQANPSRTIYVVKQATGSTNLEVSWDQGGAGAQWNALVAKYNAAVADLEGDGFTVIPSHFFWMQGESDAGHGDYAPAYEANLTEFFASVRTLTGYATKMIVGRISKYLPDYNLKGTVRAAQEDVVDADGNAILISTDPVPMETGTPHFSSPDGFNLLGLYFHQAYAGVYILPPTITSAYEADLVEGDPFSLTLTADRAVTWAIGGADAAEFGLSGNSLTMTARDYEAPADAGGNNSYVVVVTATDGDDIEISETIIVTVTNIEDGGGDPGGWTPAELFVSGTRPGAWWEPTPVNSKQQSDGTIAVEVGDPIGYVADGADNTNHAIQVTAPLRPVQRQTVGGMYYAEFDQSNDWLEKALMDLTANMTIMFVAKRSGVNNLVLFSDTTGARYVWVGQSGSSSAAYNSAGSPTFEINGAALGGTTRGDIWSAMPDDTWVVGAVIGADLTSWEGASFRWGDYSGGFEGIDGIAAVLVVDAMTPEERAQAATYLGELAGLTL